MKIRFIYVIIGIMTACISYHIYHNIFLAFINWGCWPITWAYWLITNQVNLTIIKETFSYFLS